MRSKSEQYASIREGLCPACDGYPRQAFAQASVTVAAYLSAAQANLHIKKFIRGHTVEIDNVCTHCKGTGRATERDKQEGREG